MVCSIWTLIQSIWMGIQIPPESHLPAKRRWAFYLEDLVASGYPNCAFALLVALSKTFLNPAFTQVSPRERVKRIILSTLLFTGTTQCGDGKRRTTNFAITTLTELSQNTKIFQSGLAPISHRVESCMFPVLTAFCSVPLLRPAVPTHLARSDSARRPPLTRTWT